MTDTFEHQPTAKKGIFWISRNGVYTPKWMVYINEDPMNKWMNKKLGVPSFMEVPIYLMEIIHGN